MSITFLKVNITNPELPKKSQECEFLVDSSEVYSVVPQSILKKLRIKATSSQEFILANGEIVKRSVGNAYFEYGGKIRAAPVIFGDEGVFLLGATTIKALGMILDPIKRELKPLPMLLM